MLTGDDLLEALADLFDRHPAGEDAPYLGYVDGALAALTIMPDIPPEEWLPRLGAGPDVAFADPADGERLARLLRDRKAEIAAELVQGGLTFAPFYHFDDKGEPAWQLWLLGFSGMIALRRDYWEKLLDSDDEDIAAAAMGIMTLLLTLPGFVHLQSDEDSEELADLAEEAPDLVPYFVETIYRRQHGLERVVLTEGWEDALTEPWAPATPIRTTKIGRNEPCPCGSGKKYKKCCGAAA